MFFFNPGLHRENPTWANVNYWHGGVVAERSSLPDSSSGVSSRMWVRIPVVTLVSLSKTLNHNCFVLRMGRKAVGPVCCVMHVKERRTFIVKEKGLAPVFLEWQLNAPKLFAPRNRFLYKCFITLHYMYNLNYRLRLCMLLVPVILLNSLGM